jgi:hypothetical protein
MGLYLCAGNGANAYKRDEQKKFLHDFLFFGFHAEIFHKSCQMAGEERSGLFTINKNNLKAGFGIIFV